MRTVSRLVVLVALLGLVAGAAEAQMSFPQSVASGDPRPDSVVLWTRVAVADPGNMPRSLQLEVATDESFTAVVVERTVQLNPAYDGVVKVQVDGLAPDTFHWYRFSAGGVSSPVGRTRTAPSAGDPRAVRYAVVYCQDYVGRWYNSYAKLLADHDEDLDFVVQLGDAIYETTGDPGFQDPSSERGIEFSDEAGAIDLGGGNLAAASLSNYRDLYRTYRSDPMLMEAHRRWPLIAIWDDHEFSNDSWGATATYTGGRMDELDEVRKRAAEQAWYEWMPVAAGLGADGTLEVDSSVLWPSTRIYTDFRFGRHLHLLLTDTRTYRPDHLVPEDAFPGEVVVDEATLRQLLGDAAFEQVRASFDPYVDFGLWGAVLPIFRHTASLVVAQAYQTENPALSLEQALAIARARLDGRLVSATFLNAAWQAAGWPPPFGASVLSAAPRGLSNLLLGKTSMYGAFGSRNILLWDTYQLYAAMRWLTTGGAAQDLFGPTQNAWLQSLLVTSHATWRVVASSVMATPLLVDFTHPQIAALLPPEFPDALRTRLLLTADQWDGFPQKRQELLGTLAFVPNSVILSGDIHATFVTDHGDSVFEFTGPAISSATFQTIVERAVLEHPLLGGLPGLDQLVGLLPVMLQVSTTGGATTSEIAYARTANHGFMIMEVGPEAITARLVEAPESSTFTSFYDDPDALDDLYTVTVFEVRDGELIQLP